MSGFGQTPVSTTPLGTNQFPVSAVAVPGHANGDLTALKGGPETTDANGNKEAAAAMYTYDGENETLGAKANTAATDSTSSWSAIALLKGLYALLAGILRFKIVDSAGTNQASVSAGGAVKVDGSGAVQPVSGTFWQATQPVQQADLTATGTISTAQPVIGTPVTNATVQLALGQGQSSWMAQLTAGAGFTSATTIVVDQTIDGGTTWFVTNFKVAGSLTNTPVQSIVGPGPLLLSGDAASKGIIRIRCSVLNASETINVQLRSGAGVGSVGLLSSIPAGSNYMGYVEDIEQASYIAATSPPSATNVGTDTPYTFSSQVNRVIIQNNTSVNVNLAFDVAATAGSLLIVPGALLVYPKKCTVLHLFTAAAANLNGTTAGNLVVLGAL